MTKNNSRQTATISRIPVLYNQISRSVLIRIITIRNILITSIFLLSFALISTSNVAIAQPNDESTDLTIRSSQDIKTNEINEDLNNAEALYAGPKEPKKNPVQNSNNSLFDKSALTDLSSPKNNSENKNAATNKTSSPKKTTVTSEVLLNLDYDDPGNQKKDSSLFGSLISGAASVIRYILSIAFVLALGIFAIYGIKLFSTKYGTLTGAGDDLLNVLEVKHIAPGKAICIVEIAGKALILSMAGNTINYLSDITDQEKVEALKQKAGDKKVEPLQPFQVMLERVTNRYTDRKTKHNTGANNRSHDGKARVKRVENTSEWQDDLHTTGDNIRKLLEEIAERDKPARKTRPASKRDRGGERK